MSNGYIIHLYGGEKAFAKSIDDVKLIIEALVEAPIYAQEEDDTAFLSTLDVLDEITGRILFTEFSPLGEEEDLEFPLAEGTNVREIFDFSIKIKNEKVTVRVNFKRNR